ncbi:hypothetical protein [Microlunatus parietis]|uniref:Uncharacterized protein n=1 Tax=Microlunatus parietis TaxID=682979 RepID=A0A7Y9IA53_9ACTN|nr:hypothetical protein [Microlunatus parietis]NYE72910.1 hypothetical protein [Microlunatus parietis]
MTSRNTIDRLGLLLAARIAAFLLAGVGILGGLACYLIPSPAGSIGGRAVGYLLGTPAAVELPESCESGPVRRRSGGTRNVTCKGATWTIDGREESGTLYGELAQVSDGGYLKHVVARVYEKSAYLAPPALEFSAGIAPPVLLGFGLLAGILSIPCWLHPGLRETLAGWEVEDVMLCALVGLALAASIGAIPGFLLADDDENRLTAVAVVVGSVICVGLGIRHRRRRY